MVTDLFDVIMLNRYYGWYVNSGDLRAAEPACETELAGVGANARQADHHDRVRRRHHRRPALVTPMPWTEEYQAELLEMSTASSTASTPSSASRSGTSPTSPPARGIFRVDGNKKGVFTRDRRPKAAAHLLRRRWQRPSEHPSQGGLDMTSPGSARHDSPAPRAMEKLRLPQFLGYAAATPPTTWPSR